MIRLPLLAATLVAATFTATASAQTPAPVRAPRLVRMCDDAGQCRQVPQAQVRRALLSAGGPNSLPAETAASGSTNRNQLSTLLDRLR